MEASPVLALPQLNAEEARQLTDAVKAQAHALWLAVYDLHERGAHAALGYESWHAYCKAEFDIEQAQAYRLLHAGRVAAVIQMDNGDPPANEAQAREFAPLLKRPEALREAWSEVQERAESEQRPVTAALVQEVVAEKRDAFTGAAMSSKTDMWATPQALFDVLDSEFGFTLDVCAAAENAKCVMYYDAEQDGLAQPWTGVCWMNPPYGDEIAAWVRKAYESGRSGRATVVCLVPARTDTAWWWDYARFGEIRFLRGRLKFGAGTNSAPFPSAVVIFGSAHPAKVVWWER